MAKGVKINHQLGVIMDAIDHNRKRAAAALREFIKIFRSLYGDVWGPSLGMSLVINATVSALSIMRPQYRRIVMQKIAQVYELIGDMRFDSQKEFDSFLETAKSQLLEMGFDWGGR